MPNEPDWETGDGVIDIRDPDEIDAAFDRGERHVGTAVIGMVLHGEDIAVLAPRVERAMRSPDPYVRQLGCVAAGDMARLYTTLSPGIYAVLRAEGLGGVADSAIRDTLTFIPFRQLPWWMRRLDLWLSVRDTVEGRLLRLQDFTEESWGAVKGVLGRARRRDE
ncbi:hypothetical protein [Streptomyces natalensis]|uniref:Uncharacterized protein n=1 Tax=Streptomyces natalensis ATCC 27448 TaxID=1240678 RepID=A0A0D7CEN7_9ACTN|nr:hypothetical protein [Streptomyces natalensis]KIZ14531.1 hypothetical protein SNA_36340 [Streptomyces natalensis ATCC 27448]